MATRSFSCIDGTVAPALKKLMDDVFDAKECLSSAKYKSICDMIAGSNDVLQSCNEPGLADLLDVRIKWCRDFVRDLTKILAELKAIKSRHEATTRKYNAKMSKRKKPDKPLLIGPPSTHGGSKRANNTEMIYRVRQTRGRGF